MLLELRAKICVSFWPSGRDLLANLKKPTKYSWTLRKKFLARTPSHLIGAISYKQPVTKHFELALGGLPRDPVSEWLKQIVETPGQISAFPNVTRKIDEYLAGLEDLSEAEAKEIRPMLGAVFGVAFSFVSSLRCVLYHGCFLNELIERVRIGDDKALFDAIRIDPTVIGCRPAIQRISKATLLKDVRFFTKLRTAINGKIAKREQANFQKMRLVFEILHEAGATRLSNDQLHQLFVEELRLYASNDKAGGNAKALRKFDDTYTKKNSTT